MDTIEQSMEERITTVGIERQRLYGLHIKAKKRRPKTSTTSFLDHILEEAGIPRLTKKEWEKQDSQLESEE